MRGYEIFTFTGNNSFTFSHLNPWDSAFEICISSDPNGKVQKDVWNEGTKHKHVKYYYQDGEECKYNI